jgi:hypothetical protein
MSYKAQVASFRRYVSIGMVDDTATGLPACPRGALHRAAACAVWQLVLQLQVTGYFCGRLFENRVLNNINTL